MKLICRDRKEDVKAWLHGEGPGEVVKDGRRRSVHRWKGMYVKRFKREGWIGALRGVFFDPAAREFRLLEDLRHRGLPAPEPVAWAREGSSSYLFTREIEGARPVREAPLDGKLLRALAGFVRRLHDAGFRSGDLHVGNILVSEAGFHLVDAQEASLGGALVARERTESLAFLELSFYGLVRETDVIRFLRAYGADPREVRPAFQAARERYYLGRQARAWKNGTKFEVVNGLALRRPYAAETARAALAASPLRVVKETPSRRLWLADPKTFVKEGARAAWTHAFGLEIRGIPTPRLHACFGDRVVGEWLDGALPLGEHFQAEGVSREFLWRLARLVRRMHVRGVFHRDLKANNVIVRDGRIFVIDLDRVEFSREVCRTDRIWNLAQLNAAVGKPVTRTDRLRFFLAYAGRDREMRLGWKSWVREIMARTLERRHVWPPTA